MDLLFTNENLIISAPTAAGNYKFFYNFYILGKTVLFELAMLKILFHLPNNMTLSEY